MSEVPKITVALVTIKDPDDLVYKWLMLFMTSVGFLKTVGFLKHKNSRVVGILELLGGLVFLPAWSKICVSSGLTATNVQLIGSFMILVALGMVTADEKKRLSPVCWIHAVLVSYFLFSLGVTVEAFVNFEWNPMLAAPFFFGYGHLMGRMNSQGKTKEN